MKKALILALFVAAPLLIFSQKPVYRVLAESGLKLRETPGMDGKVLAVAPFWSEVEVLAELGEHDEGGRQHFEGDFKMDTIGIAYKFQYSFPQSKTVSTILNFGRWLPVIFNGQKGFMFERYIGPDNGELRTRRKKKCYEEITEDYRLRTIHGNDEYSNDPEIEPDWFWYGLFRTTENDYETRPVRLRYLAMGNQINTLTFDPIQPVFIFGSKKKWKTKKTENFAHLLLNTSCFSQNFDQYVNAINYLGLNLTQTHNDGESYCQWSAIRPDGTFQPMHVGETGYYGYEKVEWVGDLDGDGEFDYILAIYGLGGVQDLYLSSAAGDGDAVRLVARLRYFGC